MSPIDTRAVRKIIMNNFDDIVEEWQQFKRQQQ